MSTGPSRLVELNETLVYYNPKKMLTGHVSYIMYIFLVGICPQSLLNVEIFLGSTKELTCLSLKIFNFLKKRTWALDSKLFSARFIK